MLHQQLLLLLVARVLRCAIYPHLAPSSLSLSLCCAQRMFIQALSSRLSGDWAFLTELKTKQLLQNHAGETHRKCGCMSLFLKLCMLHQKRKKTMKNTCDLVAKQKLSPRKQKFFPSSDVFFIVMLVYACHSYLKLWPNNDSCYGFLITTSEIFW